MLQSGARQSQDPNTLLSFSIVVCKCIPAFHCLGGLCVPFSRTLPSASPPVYAKPEVYRRRVHCNTLHSTGRQKTTCTRYNATCRHNTASCTTSAVSTHVDSHQWVPSWQGNQPAGSIGETPRPALLRSRPTASVWVAPTNTALSCHLSLGKSARLCKLGKFTRGQTGVVGCCLVVIGASRHHQETSGGRFPIGVLSVDWLARPGAAVREGYETCMSHCGVFSGFYYLFCLLVNSSGMATCSPLEKLVCQPNSVF